MSVGGVSPHGAYSAAILELLRALKPPEQTQAQPLAQASQGLDISA